MIRTQLVLEDCDYPPMKRLRIPGGIMIDMATGKKISAQEQIQRLEMQIWTIHKNCMMQDIVWNFVN